MAEPIEPELQQIIQNMEQILEVLPKDSAILYTLFEAYRKSEQEEKAVQCLTQLSDVSISNESAEESRKILNLISHSGLQLPNHNEILQRLEKLSTSQKAVPRTRVASSGTGGKEISNELALAWKLLQGEEIDKEDYSAIVSDLSQTATRSNDVPVSVMHVLQDRGMKNLEKIIAAIIVDSGVPLISLNSFDFPTEAWSLLPQDFMIKRGALVFERMGTHALVAILNPYDIDLQNDVRNVTGVPCHFYITNAADYDEALEKVQQLHAKEQLEEFEASHRRKKHEEKTKPAAPSKPHVEVRLDPSSDEAPPEPPPEEPFNPSA
jgi:hypothetical protein